jgi:hypothetical protein
MGPPEKHFSVLILLSHKQSDSVTVNHQVGGSSPPQGAILNLQLTHPLVGIVGDHTDRKSPGRSGEPLGTSMTKANQAVRSSPSRGAS